MKILARILRNHLPFVVIVPLLIIVMTWPTIVHVFDASVFWVSRRDIDVNMLFWDAWYFKLLVTGQADFYYTDLLFHPQGVSLAFHNFSLPHMMIFSGLQSFMPAISAFNLTYLILVYLTIMSGYIFFYHVFRDKWLSLFGAVVFGASTFVLTRPGQASTYFIATLPLSLYFLHRGIVEERGKFFIISGALVGVTAFIGIYILVCILLTMLLYIPFFALSRWKAARFWLRLFAMFLVAAGIAVVRFYPMLADSELLSSALDKNVGSEEFNDLLGYFTNYGNPITRPVFESVFGPDPVHSDVYLGYVPLLLVFMGVAGRRRRSEKALWLLLLLPFLILRLGSSLTVNDVQYAGILLPKHYLTELFPYIFGPFWSTNNFQPGVLLPFAVLTCYGLLTLLRSVPAKRRVGVIIVLVMVVLFEYYHEIDPRVVPKGQFNFLDWLRQENDQESIHLINLPMGGQNSKYYGFYQTFTGYPHAEGRPTRTPSTAFAYIDGNALLSAWRKDESFHCLPSNREQFNSALDQLLADGFSHIVVHKWRALKVLHMNRFAGVAPAYEDHYVTIYRVKDLRSGCANSAFLDLGPRFSVADTVAPSAILPESGAAVLSIHPSGNLDGALARYYASTELHPHQLVPLKVDDLRDDRSPEPELQRFDPNTVLESRSVFLLVYDPQRTDAGLRNTYSEWIGRHLRTCGHSSDSDDATVEYYLDADFPCALLIADQPMQVAYDNGIEIGNLLYKTDGNTLELNVLWTSLPQDTHAVSVQFVDDEGSRIGGQDFVFHYDPLSYHRIDLSSLDPGEYVAKMILYNYGTRVSVPGTVTSSDTRFDREFEFARFRRE